jgi:hypothetical protein
MNLTPKYQPEELWSVLLILGAITIVALGLFIDFVMHL